nr:dehydrogenase/reductase sdr family member 7b [Quercus suber]
MTRSIDFGRYVSACRDNGCSSHAVRQRLLVLRSSPVAGLPRMLSITASPQQHALLHLLIPSILVMVVLDPADARTVTWRPAGSFVSSAKCIPNPATSCIPDTVRVLGTIARNPVDPPSLPPALQLVDMTMLSIHATYGLNAVRCDNPELWAATMAKARHHRHVNHAFRIEHEHLQDLLAFGLRVLSRHCAGEVCWQACWQSRKSAFSLPVKALIANIAPQVVVTGTSAGIGRSIAKAFAAAGASVAAVARREADLNVLVEEITAAGGKAVAVAADIAARGAPKDIVARVERELGPVDILVNNAGISRISPVPAEDEEMDIWWRVYEVNVRAAVSLIRAVLPAMIERNSGIVMSTSSSVATLALPAMTAYASSKAALSKFHELLAVELQNTNVLTYAVHPGIVPSELGKADNAINRAAMEHPAMKTFIASAMGAHKRQSPELCANLMVSLAADERAKVLTGHHLNADQEIGPVYEEAAKTGKGRIGEDRLYLVNIAAL